MAYNAIDQGISNLYSATVPGQTSPQVKQLQEALIAAGYNIPAGATGFYGSQTKAALDQWKAKLSQGGTQTANQPASIPASSATQADIDKLTNEVKTVLPSLTKEKTASTAEEIMNAFTTGDWSGIVKSDGKPFSAADQQAAVDAARSALEPYYKGQAEKDKADVEAALKQKQLDYQKQLAESKISFESDKSTLDQQAADQGILFSGSRAQKQKALEDKYSAADEYNRASMAGDIGRLARDYQNVQGQEAAKGLSDYFNIGGNTYNASVATGGAGSRALSSAYNPSAYNFGTGTAQTSKLSEIYKRAGGILANKANKLALGSYSNQF